LNNEDIKRDFLKFSVGLIVLSFFAFQIGAENFVQKRDIGPIELTAEQIGPLVVGDSGSVSFKIKNKLDSELEDFKFTLTVPKYLRIDSLKLEGNEVELLDNSELGENYILATEVGKLGPGQETGSFVLSFDATNIGGPRPIGFETNQPDDDEESSENKFLGLIYVKFQNEGQSGRVGHRVQTKKGRGVVVGTLTKDNPTVVAKGVGEGKSSFVAKDVESETEVVFEVNVISEDSVEEETPNVQGIFGFDSTEIIFPTNYIEDITEFIQNDIVAEEEVFIFTYSSPEGDSEYNQRLAEMRGEALGNVVRELLGDRALKITTIPEGVTEAFGSCEESYEKNRRVVLRKQYLDGKFPTENLGHWVFGKGRNDQLAGPWKGEPVDVGQIAQNAVDNLDPGEFLWVEGYSSMEGGGHVNQILSENRAKFLWSKIQDYANSKNKGSISGFEGMGRTDSFGVCEGLAENRRYVIATQPSPSIVLQQSDIVPGFKDLEEYYDITIEESGGVDKLIFKKKDKLWQPGEWERELRDCRVNVEYTWSKEYFPLDKLVRFKPERFKVRSMSLFKNMWYRVFVSDCENVGVNGAIEFNYPLAEGEVLRKSESKVVHVEEERENIGSVQDTGERTAVKEGVGESRKEIGYFFNIWIEDNEDFSGYKIVFEEKNEWNQELDPQCGLDVDDFKKYRLTDRILIEELDVLELGKDEQGFIASEDCYGFLNVEPMLITLPPPRVPYNLRPAQGVVPVRLLVELAEPSQGGAVKVLVVFDNKGEGAKLEGIEEGIVARIYSLSEGEKNWRGSVGMTDIGVMGDSISNDGVYTSEFTQGTFQLTEGDYLAEIELPENLPDELKPYEGYFNGLQKRFTIS
tara:strand:- start:11919 stop:14498 length:2580 start_codon:yes stop_codon:yes gene_type:complete